MATTQTKPKPTTTRIVPNTVTDKKNTKESIAKLKEILDKHGIPYAKDVTLEELEHIIAELLSGIKKHELGIEDSEDNLKARQKDIFRTANKIDEFLKNNHDENVRAAYFEELNAKLGIDLHEIDRVMQGRTGAGAGSALGSKDNLVIQDMEPSTIITGMPLRVKEQILARVLINYPLMNLVNSQNVENGVIDIFYTDYRPADNKSGYSDVEIADYNQGIEKKFQETYRAKDEYHKGYDLLDTMLNDITLTIGMYIAIIQDYVNAVIRPIAKVMYQRLITFLDSKEVSATGGVYDYVKTFAGADAKAKAKELYEFITSMSTPARSNLVDKPIGATEPLEYAMQSQNITLILNVKYASDYKYDLTSNTFQLGEIKIPVGNIIVLDFDKLAEYTTIASANSVLKTYKVIGIENGKYNEIIHYTGTKSVNTPKLKSVFHIYTRMGNYRRKDKMLFAWK